MMWRFSLGLLAAISGAHPAAAAKDASKADVAITRLDCGTVQVNHGAHLSDALTYEHRTFSLVESCYLIRHDDAYMLWDTGISPEFLGNTLSSEDNISLRLEMPLAETLDAAGVRTGDVDYVGISHFHPDHTGQLRDIPTATLLIGKPDWDDVTGKSVSGAGPFIRDHFAPWLKQGGPVQPVAKDHDVFGDGTVMIIATPGHTPGHKSLLVRLRGQGAVILSGDTAHRERNFDEALIPMSNISRADSLASIDRLKKMQTALDAMLVIQHDPSHVGKLPAAPNWMK